ncbi:MFS transporter [Ideonella livida]|uniref:MFS transporter n=1 Tax=Ideonella livida TaxID=2707176 RepID=A0A7C9TJ98_9BURK|nr:MFS transporter [Ideonella livida]NDY90087.1 MFS transporter [Ideonella livida]
MNTPEPPPQAPATSGPQTSAGASALAPLTEPVFRMLWLAWLAANICMWMNDVAAAWLMTTLTTSTTMVALVQAASTLPVFLLGLPSGALADILDRRRYFAATQLWVGLNAVVLAAVSLAGVMTAPLLLLLTFTNGVGLALRWPVFAAIVPDVVSKPNLGQALALNGVAMNLSRIIGPIVAGALLSAAGESWVFGLNALLSAVAFVMILRWRSQQRRQSALPGERFIGAMRVGLQHVWQSPPMRLIWQRVFLFFMQTAALMALLPLIARQLGGGAHLFTGFLACQGAGAVFAVMMFPRWRARFTGPQFVLWGSLAHGLATLTVALAPHPAVALVAMAVAGMAWISTANTLTVAAQMALPGWVRARGMAIYQMGLMGGTAVGAAVWGQVAGHSSLRVALASSVAFGLLLLAVYRRRPIGASTPEDLAPARPLVPETPVVGVQPEDGPVMVTVEYRIDPSRLEAFTALMQESRRARLRQGALSWGLFRDATDPSRVLEYFVDENWVEHQRRHERFTAADAGLRDRRLAFHIGAEPPAVHRYVAQDGHH